MKIFNFVSLRYEVFAQAGPALGQGGVVVDGVDADQGEDDEELRVIEDYSGIVTILRVFFAQSG